MEEGFCSEGGGEVGHREGAGVMVGERWCLRG